MDKVIHSTRMKFLAMSLSFDLGMSDFEENIEIGDERFNLALICLFRQCEIHQWKLEITVPFLSFCYLPHW